jgi:hypothetical protein
MNKLLRSLTGLGTCVGLMAVASESHAYDLLMCGSTHLRTEADITFRMDRCTVSAGGTAELDFQNAAYTWNVVKGIWDRFPATVTGNPSNNCSANLQGNGLPDFQILSSLPSGFAMAWFTGFGQSPQTCDDPEWDVIMASSGFQTGVQSELQASPSRRNALVHELGHVLGMAHETTNNRVSSMIAFTPQVMLGGSANERSGVYADDAAYGIAFHGSGQTSFDLAVSSWMRASNQSGTLTMADSIQSGCTGSSIAYTATWTNKGTQAIAPGSPATLKVYLSSDDTITTSDILVQTWSISGTQGSTSTWTSSITIPSSLTLNATYRLGIIVDPSNTIAEHIENNNISRLSRRVKRTC